MRAVRGLSAIVMLAMAAAMASDLQAAEDKKGSPAEKLETAIPEGIRLLEAKEYLPFLKMFMEPELYNKITEKIPPEELAKKFGEEPAARILSVFKMIKSDKPTYSDDGARATYKLKEAVDGKDKLTFKKTGKYWYIEN